jgi:2'-5' RNA ligase
MSGLKNGRSCEYPAPTVTALMTWLTPAPGPTRDQLVAIIGRLAAEYGRPRFQPHVTVLVTFDGAEDAVARTLESLVADVPPLELTFTAIGHEQTYFRSLYLRAAPSAQLQALQEAGQRAFALDRLPPAPHLSLLYSGLTDERKRPIIDALGVTLPLTVRFDAVDLWGRDPRGVHSWYHVARVPLPGMPTA